MISQVIGPSLDLSGFNLTTFCLILGGLFFFAIGFADDVLQLPPVPRLLAQFAVTSFLWWMGVRVEYLPIPFIGAVSVGFLSLPITVIWVSGVANAINWLDGLDGLAAGVGAFGALILAGTAAFHGQYAVTFLSLSLCGALIAFLRFNLPPAKIYMGDGGSYLIGYYLATLCVLGLFATQSMSSSLAPFFILGIPIVDMTAVMAARILNGKSPLYPDRRHLHHRLLHEGCSKMFSTGFIWALSSWVGSLALVIANPMWGGICFSMVSVILVGMTIQLAQTSKIKKKATLISMS